MARLVGIVRALGIMGGSKTYPREILETVDRETMCECDKYMNELYCLREELGISHIVMNAATT